jgi:hypothetical protein
LARAGRASKIGTRAGRVVRVIRLVRLIKLVKKKEEVDKRKSNATKDYHEDGNTANNKKGPSNMEPEKHEEAAQGLVPPKARSEKEKNKENEKIIHMKTPPNNDIKKSNWENSITSKSLLFFV